MELSHLFAGVGLVAVCAAAYVVVRRNGHKEEKGSAVQIVGDTKSTPKKTAVPEEEEDLHFKVFYGSQTGTAESFANRFVKEASDHGLKAKTFDLEDYEPERLANEKVAVFLMATYGEGEPTDSAAKFHDWLLEGGHSLDNLSFTVFGLGNRQYEYFNAMGKLVDTKLSELGAKRIHSLGLGDDDGTLEDDYEAWKENVWSPLRRSCGLGEAERVIKKKATVPKYKVVIHEDGVFEDVVEKLDTLDGHELHYANVSTVRELHSELSDRSCLHLELDMEGYSTPYHTGDHVGLYAPNSVELVERAASVLGISLDKMFSLEMSDGSAMKTSRFPQPVSFRRALTSFVDLTMPIRKSTLKVMAEFATSEEDIKKLQYLSSKEGKAEFDKTIAAAEMTLLDILATFRSISLPLPLFFELSPRLPVRYYSISSSARVFPKMVHVTCSVVDYVKPTGQQYRGVCSGWLQDQFKAGKQIMVPCFIRHSTFRLPASPSTPILMVGPGTGLAPLRGFIQERQHLKENGEAIGPMALYFGCQNREKDFIYQEELMEAARSGLLTELHLAFSREQEKKVYVQDLLRDNSDKVWALLDQGAYVYVCGALKMAKEVKKAIVEVVASNGKMSGNEAEKFVHSLVEKGLYQQDAW